MKSTNVTCEVSKHHLQMGAIMYASYFILFAHFFYKAYFSGPGAKTKNKRPEIRKKSSIIPSENNNGPFVKRKSHSPPPVLQKTKVN
ncbi:unnamed protein product [Allacma fusca]|uniref:Uncharacterized protein n=1 Tax=Allacma fusca TaxID=39272 RepID=A0A8J2PDW6_9HEXA|nr:unnamed protein product [Allacma fusca]